MKSRVKRDRPFRYQDYVLKCTPAAFKIGEQEEIVNWLTKQEYNALSEDDKRDYAYFEWNEWGDWYGVYNEIVHLMDALLAWFSEWSFYYFIDCPCEERYPSGEQVRLVVYRC